VVSVELYGGWRYAHPLVKNWIYFMIIFIWILIAAVRKCIMVKTVNIMLSHLHIYTLSSTYLQPLWAGLAWVIQMFYTTILINIDTQRIYASHKGQCWKKADFPGQEIFKYSKLELTAWLMPHWWNLSRSRALIHGGHIH
jgi:hypothetical protein